MSITAFLILSFSSLFAVIDPLGVIPFFSGLTSGMDLRRKRKVLVKSLITAFLVLLMFTVVGHQVLELFGITVDAFRIAGGVIFFGIGLDMLQSKPQRWRTGIGKAYAKDVERHVDEAEARRAMGLGHRLLVEVGRPREHVAGPCREGDGRPCVSAVRVRFDVRIDVRIVHHRDLARPFAGAER